MLSWMVLLVMAQKYKNYSDGNNSLLILKILILNIFFPAV